jgi:hypothetical protein
MSASDAKNSERPMAEPATERSGNEVGGMRAGADRGFGDATQRSMQHADTSPLGRASSGDASGGAADPRLDLGGTNAPGAAATSSAPANRPAADDRAAARGDGAAPGPSGGAGAKRREDDDEDEWRHDPVAPVDERNPLKSLGRAIADVATGGAEDTSEDTSTPRTR